MTQLPSGTVTFCFTDIEGSTQLFAKLGPRFMELLDDHRRIIRDAVAAHDGAEVKTEGDGFFLAFGDPAKAIAACIDFQRALASHPWPDGSPIKVRAGLHIGVAEPSEGDYMVFEVHEAARIGAAGHGGQTVISDTLKTLVARQLPPKASLRDLGEHTLKDLEPMRLHQVCHPELVGDFPPLRSAREQRGYVPAPASSLVGRDGDVDDLVGRLSSARLLTITGAGGVGKTRLAVEIARHELGRRPDGVWFIDLAKLTDAGWLDDTVLEAIGAVKDSSVETRAQLLSTLASRDTLLIVDNCEHVVGPSSELIDAILQASTRTVVIATSREPLGIDGEIVWRARSLDTGEASELFMQRARSVNPDVTLDADAVTRIVDRLDGIPLAIELAAARCRVLAPSQIAERLDDRFRLLTGGSRTALPRQRTLEATVDWSYQLLDDDERTLLRRLTVFVGGFDLDAAESIWDGDVLDVLGRLVDKSMVVASLQGDTVRYRMLETIRAYGWLKLVDAEEGPDARNAHASHFAGVAADLGDGLVDSREVSAAAILTLEHENIRAALEWSLEAAPETAATLTGNLWLYWSVVGRTAEGLRWLERALAVAGGVDVETLAKMHAGMAHLSSVAETPNEVVRGYAQLAVDHARTRSNRHWYDAWALMQLSWNLTDDLGNDPDTVAEAVEWASRAGSDVVLSQAMGTQAFLIFGDRRRAEALARMDEAVAVARRSGAASCIGQLLQQKAELLLSNHNDDEAHSTALEAVAAAQRGPNVYFVMYALTALANAKANLGHADVDVPLRRQLEVARDAGLDPQIAQALLDLGTWAIGHGDLRAARASLDEANAVMRRIVSTRRSMLLLGGRVQMGLGEIAQREGNLDEARRIFQANFDSAAAFDIAAAMAYVRLSLGWLETQAGDLDAAEAHHIAAVADIARDGNQNWARRITSASLRGLAAVSYRRGDPIAAATLSGRANEFVEFNTNVPPLAAVMHRELLAELREQLGAEAFEEAFASGERLGLDDALSGFLHA